MDQLKTSNKEISDSKVINEIAQKNSEENLNGDELSKGKNHINS